MITFVESIIKKSVEFRSFVIYRSSNNQAPAKTSPVSTLSRPVQIRLESLTIVASERIYTNTVLEILYQDDRWARMRVSSSVIGVFDLLLPRYSDDVGAGRG